MDNYILILANLPEEKSIKDGMILREIAIDKILSNFNRIYVENIDRKLSILKQPRKWIKDKLFSKTINLKYFSENNITYSNVSKKEFYKLCKNAKKIYAHSLICLKRIPKEYIEEFKDKIIVDIHGCVVEESIFNNAEKETVQEYQDIEKFAFPIINTLIAVTENMIELYKSKYPGIKTNFIQLPIFLKNISESEEKEEKYKLNIIYSGRAQKWQKIDLMAEIIPDLADKYNITILTPDTKIFNSLLKDVVNKVTIKSVSPDKINEEYRKADLGFILRDNIIVNTVACPTKIIDYLEYGIIPIVDVPNIGDFERLGYSYIKYKDLLNEDIPSFEKLKIMRDNNYKIIEKIKNIKKSGEEKLLKIIK